MNEKASKVNMPTANAATLAAIETSSQPRSESSSFASLPNRAHDAREEPEPAEEAERADLEQCSEPLVVEDVGARAADVRVHDPGAEALRRRAASASTRFSAGPRSASRPLPLRARHRLLLGDQAACGQERVLDRAERSGQHELDHDQRRNQRRPHRRVSCGRSQRKTSATTTNIRIPVRETVEAQPATSKRDAEPPAALAVPPRQIERERGEHDEGRAQRDRMLRRAEDPQLRGAELQERPGLALRARLQERDHAIEMVEGVEPGAGLDDREERDDRAARRRASSRGSRCCRAA